MMRAIARSAAISSLSLILAPPAYAASPFGVRLDYSVGISQVRVLAADLDKDGLLDLAIFGNAAYANQGRIQTFFGYGDGAFHPGPTSSTFEGILDVALADFDVDGAPDAAIVGNGPAGSLNGVQVLRNDGDGHFTATQNFYYGSVPGHSHTSPHTVDALDLDGDGRLDLALSAIEGPFIRQLAISPGVFGPPEWLPLTYGIASEGVVQDLDGDGDPDVAYTGSAAASAFLRNDGPNVLTALPGPAFSNAVSRQLSVGDFDGDSMLDAAYTAVDQAAVTIWRGNGVGGAQTVPSDVGGNGIAAGDFDGDGLQDLVTANELSGRVLWFKGHGDATFDAGSPVLTGARPRDVIAADLNGDGLMDVAVLDAGNGTLSLLYQGNPTVGVPGSGPARGALALSAPSPNPARGTSPSVTFELPNDRPGRIAVLDVRGRTVESRALAHPTAGRQAMRIFESARPAAGVYWLELTQGSDRIARRFVLLP